MTIPGYGPPKGVDGRVISLTAVAVEVFTYLRHSPLVFDFWGFDGTARPLVWLLWDAFQGAWAVVLWRGSSFGIWFLGIGQYGKCTLGVPMICIDGCMGASRGCKTQLRSGVFGDMTDAQLEALLICSKTLEAQLEALFVCSKTRIDDFVKLTCLFTTARVRALILRVIRRSLA